MNIIMTSSLGGTIKENGKRLPTILIEKNNQLKMIQSMWKENSNVLLIAANPDNYEKNQSVVNCLKESFLMSGLKINKFEICDNRNLGIINELSDMDVILILGGHVPTENAFLKKIELKEKLKNFKGLVLSYSAGSMNLAEIVYAAPELEGEAISEDYKRFIEGLGLTKIKVLPHFEEIRNDVIDGMKFLEDVALPDSYNNEFIGLNNGSYIIIDENNKVKLYGEAYMIKNGKVEKICSDNEMKEI